jgi:hypothetical protein
MGSFGYAQDDRRATFFVILSGNESEESQRKGSSLRSFGYAQDDRE